MITTVKNEIKATWAGGSRFDRFLMCAFTVFVPYDIIRGNWFDMCVALVVLLWIWQSVKEETINGA